MVHEHKHRSIPLVNAILLIDPTRTARIVSRFNRALMRRFTKLQKLITIAIVEKDVFGLKPATETYFSDLEIGFKEAVDKIRKRQFAFPKNDRKVTGFMQWLKEMEEQSILETSIVPGSGRATDQAWTDVFIQSSYQKGIARGRQELIKKGYPVASFKEQPGGLSGVFNQPVHADRVGLLYTRSFNELKGITAAMDQAISRELAQGLAEGKGPREIARRLNNRVAKIGKSRATTLARTEIIRAHHGANIQEYRNANVAGVGVKAEWSTAKFNVCKYCSAFEGRIFSLDRIEFMIPAHPKCRCVAIPIPYSPVTKKKRGREVDIEGPALPDELPRARRFTNAKEADAWGKKYSGKYLDGLDEADLHVVHNYTAVGYHDVNDVLRGKAIRGSVDEINKEIEQITRVIDNAPAIKKDMYAWRGSKSASVLKRFEDMDLGDMIEDKAFMSTALHKSEALEFVRKAETSSIMRIRIPEGTKALYPRVGYETELLLQKNTRLKLVSKSIDKDGIQSFNFELVPKGKVVPPIIKPPKPKPTPKPEPPKPKPKPVEPESKIPIRFTTKEESNRWGDELSDKYKESLSEEAAKAVDAYQGPEYEHINKSLRYGEAAIPEGPRSLIKRRIEELTKVLDNAPKTQQDIMAWRGYSNKDVHEKFMSMNLGDVLHDKGFMSTSLIRETSEYFVGKDRFGVMAHIHIPKGTRTLYMDHKVLSQTELLLNRGQKLKLISKAVDENDVLILNFKLVEEVVEDTGQAYFKARRDYSLVKGVGTTSSDPKYYRNFKKKMVAFIETLDETAHTTFRKNLVTSSLKTIQGGVIDKTIIKRAIEATDHIPTDIMTEMIDWQGYTFTISGKQNLRASFRSRDKTSFVTMKGRNGNVDAFAHEWGHAVDDFFSRRGGYVGDYLNGMTGLHWEDGIEKVAYVTKRDAQDMRIAFKSHTSGEIGTYASGDGKFYKDNWMEDYEGRIYDKGGIGQEWWAMNMSRLNGFHRAKIKHANVWKKLPDIERAGISMEEYVTDKTKNHTWKRAKKMYKQLTDFMEFKFDGQKFAGVIVEEEE